jgi:hypothetical protein
VADLPYQFLIPLVLIDLTLKGLALWLAAKKDQKVWFVVLLILNTVGILPAIYLFLNRHDIKIHAKFR